MKRLFVFGCSYTNHDYPTWADFLSVNYDYYENWGKPGLGNRGIFNRLSECVLKKQISSKDTIIVCWSTPIREDRWFEGKGWVAVGNIYNQDFYPSEWVEKYFDPIMGCMETINYVNAAKHLLDNLGCSWKMCWMDLLNFGSHKENLKTKSLLEICDQKMNLLKSLEKCVDHPNILNVSINDYKETLTDKLKLPKTVINYSQFYKREFLDEHPNPIVGYHYTKEILCKSLNIENFDSENKILEFAKEWLDYLSNYPRTSKEPKFLYSGLSKYSTFPKVAW